MTVHVKPRMTVEQFFAWAVEQPKRYELLGGEVFAMSPQTAGHAETKAAIHSALCAGIRRSNLACHALPDGMTVKTDEETAYEPDSVVYCGEKLPRSALIVPSPVVVVEVLSPSNQQIDLSQKLIGYFRLPSVMHYLIVDPNQPTIIRHARDTEDKILTRVITEGFVTLDPPGMEFALSDIYGR